MKTKNKYFYLFLFSTAISALLSCSPSSPQHAGNSSQTDNGKVMGMLYEPDGKTPADNAIVQFIRSDNVPSPQLKKAQAATYLTTTNGAGQYFADSIPAGYYNIFGSKGEDLCYVESVIVNDSTPLPKDTLKAPGSLGGVIRLASGQDSRHVLILIFGTNSFASPLDSIGNFLLPDMAEGNYHVRLLATGGGYNYLPLDTVFSIVSGVNKTLTDTIFLRPDSLNMPLFFTAKAMEYGWVQLSWQKVNGAIIYSLYRNVTDTGAYKYIGHTIDTAYGDGDSVDFGRVYYYKVQATNSMSASPFSKAYSVLTTPAPPESVTAVAITDSQIKVSWHSVKTAIKYRAFILKTDGSSDSTAFTNDTVDTITSDYRDHILYTAKAYNSSGGSYFSKNTTIPLGAILITWPFKADSGVVYQEPLTSLYDSSNNNGFIDTGNIIMISANGKYQYLYVVGNNINNVPGSKIYSYSQLITEIGHFLQDSVCAHHLIMSPDFLKNG
ncbi:MAG: hypothetical protein PHC61_18155 [Chitinivibrionales bacterium]|nr:hypothetical protein [Chitinivibrionales bacterium]